MPTVAELTALYGNFMLAPRHGPGVCDTCFNLTRGYERCYACVHNAGWLDVVAPISYSVAGEQLHHALAAYKRLGGLVARRFTVELGAVLWRHLAVHERCVADAAGTRGAHDRGIPRAPGRPERFDVVATVPSSDPERDVRHPLRELVATIVEPTRARHERLLLRSAHPVGAREFDPGKYESSRTLSGETVLLIDDTWTTGANAQSAACALKRAGAGTVAAVVIGRHLNREWHQNDRRLQTLAGAFDWTTCAYCRPGSGPEPR